MRYRTSAIFWPFLLVIDIIGSMLFFWLRFRRLREPKRVLLIRLEHVGDVLLTTPAFRSIRKRFPKATIDVLVRDFTAQVLKKNKNVDNVIVWNAPWLSRLGSRSSWLGVPRMIRALRRNKYDLAVDFHGDPRNIALGRLVARYVVGFGARGFGFLLNKVVPYGRQHAIERNLSLAKALGADVRDRKMELPVSAADDHVAAALLNPLGKARIVCISPGSGREEKNWIPERWAAVADALTVRHKARIVLTGSKRETGLVERIISHMRNADKAVNLCDKTSIAQLAAVVRRCSLVLCPDSGTMHIARAMGTPLIGLFTAEDPREWGYDEPRFQNIKKPSPDAITVAMMLDKIRVMRCLR